jgi:hypothetical protein
MIAARHHGHRRGGFTLLEVLLASAIAILLLGALYVSFDLCLKQTDAGREAVSRGNVARDIANRMTIDFASCLGPMPPKSGGGVPEDVTANAGAAAATPTSGTAGMSSTEVAGGVATGTVDLAESEGEVAADIPFQGGLFGSAKQLTLFVSRVPPALSSPETADPYAEGSIDLRPDLRRVTYYLSAEGLCRQEKPWVTAEGIRNSADPVSGEESQDLISDEITDLTFSYFDGTQWLSDWTGSDVTTDGKSVKGPPRAIKVVMTIQPAGAADPKVVSHVIPVRAAVGLYVPPPAEEEVVPDVSTTGM